MKPITIFFDIGGTLLDGPDLFEYLTRKLSTQWPDQRTCDITRKTYFQSFPKREDFSSFKNIQQTLATILTTLSRKYGYPDISYQSRDLCLDVYGYQSKLFLETIPVLEKLFTAGVRMIIASDNDFAILEISLKKHNLEKYFVDKCISEAVKAYKPTQGFVDYLRKYTDDKDNCYFVGDSWVDVESAKRLGVKSVLIDRKKTANDCGADQTIHDLTELLSI